MKFVFSTRFYLLFAFGLVPLSLSWGLPLLRTLVFTLDALLGVAALFDYFSSRRTADSLTLERQFDKRFAIGDATRVTLHLENLGSSDLRVRIKDEFPPDM